MSDLFGGTPHWTDSPGDYALKSEAAASHIGSLFLGGLQLAAQREQRNQEMALRLKEFAATEETRKLHNQTLSARLSDDAFDTKTLGEFIPKLNSARTPEDLAALEIPEMRDPQRMHQLTTAISSKAQRLAGTTAWKALADAQSDIAKLDGYAIAEINELGGLPQTPDDLTPELYRIIGSHQDRIARTKTEEAMAIRSAAVFARGEMTGERPANAVEITTPDGKHLAWAVPGASGGMHVLPSEKPTISIHDQLQLAKDKLKEKKEELEQLKTGKPWFGKGRQEREDEIAATEKEIKDLQKQRDAVGTHSATAAPTNQAVTTQAQYDALPSGSTYIGEDGKKYRKP